MVARTGQVAEVNQCNRTSMTIPAQLDPHNGTSATETLGTGPGLALVAGPSEMVPDTVSQATECGMWSKIFRTTLQHRSLVLIFVWDHIVPVLAG